VIKWLYYYGNTVFAFRYGEQHNYNGYSQGLHGGLDFGHPGGVPVYAGVNGVWDGLGSAFGPNRVDVVIGDYRIIYGHLAKPANIARGTRIGPNTIVGEIDFGAQHMHLEIRYQSQTYILNPFLFMTQQMRDNLISRFPPEGDYAFYSSPRWRQWLTPLDQPTIIRGGPVIGPKA
jgi:murein DD-endopeptidase MepM/ murein hydrolase activator NlpD